MQPGGSSSNHTDGAAQDQAGGSHLTPRGAPVMRAIGAEKLFESMIGPGQIRHRSASKEPGPVTAGDLPEGR
jgi:hypothetical protein